MENIIILLACVVMTTATGNYKLFKMEKTEKVEVREFVTRKLFLFLLNIILINHTTVGNISLCLIQFPTKRFVQLFCPHFKFSDFNLFCFCLLLCSVSSAMVNEECSFCWYRLNWSPSLFKFIFITNWLIYNWISNVNTYINNR
jgi:hypothetical protein